MAIVNDLECSICKTITRHVNYKCCSCFQREEKERQDCWNCLPIEIKIDELKKRIEKIELKQKNILF